MQSVRARQTVPFHGYTCALVTKKWQCANLRGVSRVNERTSVWEVYLDRLRRHQSVWRLIFRCQFAAIIDLFLLFTSITSQSLSIPNMSWTCTVIIACFLCCRQRYSRACYELPTFCQGIRNLSEKEIKMGITRDSKDKSFKGSA